MDYDYQEHWEDEEVAKAKKNFLDFTIDIENQIDRIQLGLKNDGLTDAWKTELNELKDSVTAFKTENPEADTSFLLQRIEDLYRVGK